MDGPLAGAVDELDAVAEVVTVLAGVDDAVAVDLILESEGARCGVGRGDAPRPVGGGIHVPEPGASADELAKVGVEVGPVLERVGVAGFGDPPALVGLAGEGELGAVLGQTRRAPVDVGVADAHRIGVAGGGLGGARLPALNGVGATDYGALAVLLDGAEGDRVARLAGDAYRDMLAVDTGLDENHVAWFGGICGVVNGQPGLGSGAGVGVGGVGGGPVDGVLGGEGGGRCEEQGGKAEHAGGLRGGMGGAFDGERSGSWWGGWRRRRGEGPARVTSRGSALKRAPRSAVTSGEHRLV